MSSPRLPEAIYSVLPLFSSHPTCNSKRIPFFLSHAQLAHSAPSSLLALCVHAIRLVFLVLASPPPPPASLFLRSCCTLRLIPPVEAGWAGCLK